MESVKYSTLLMIVSGIYEDNVIDTIDELLEFLEENYDKEAHFINLS